MADAENWTLVALTLGLYRPFAVVNATALRLDAVSLTVLGDEADWLAAGRSATDDATGEAAGDFFGIDMGL